MKKALKEFLFEKKYKKNTKKITIKTPQIPQ